MSSVTAVTGKSIHYHDTPDKLYDELVEAFGEMQSSEHPDTKWVSLGAGQHTLTFWRAVSR